MYTTYFGLSEKPFRVTSDPRFFLANSIYQEAYASLLYGIRERQGFMVLTGEVGTGKTTLLKVLINNLEATIRYVYIGQTILTFDELLSFTCEELGLSVQGAEHFQKIRVLNEFLIAQSKKQGTVVLLIDEAQNLDEEILERLRLLSNLETATGKLLQIVLVGQPELEMKLDQPQLRQLRQRIALQRRLDHLEEREVGSYIAYRLRTVGYEQEGLFTRQAIQRIARYSKGVPRLINIICDNALLNAYGVSQKTVSPEMIDEVASDLRLAEFAITSKGEVQQPNQGQEGAEVKRQLHNNLRRDQERYFFSFATGAPTSQSNFRGAAKTSWGMLIPFRAKRLAWVGLGFLLVFLCLGIWSMALQPRQTRDHLSHAGPRSENLLGITGEQLALLKRKLSVLLASFLPQKAEVEKAQTPLETGILSALEVESQGQSAVHPPHREPEALIEQVEATGDSLDEELSFSIADSSPTLPQKTEETTEEAQNRTSSPMLTSASSDIPQSQFIIVPRGSTITQIATIWYGNHYVPLAIDLIQEYNAHIADLSLIQIGELLQLPFFSPANLIRKQVDGTTHLILTSFFSLLEAKKLAQNVRLEGYTVKIMTRWVAKDMRLFRVEIWDLETLDAVNQAWDTAMARRWFAFADDPRFKEDKWAKHTRP